MLITEMFICLFLKTLPWPLNLWCLTWGENWNEHGFYSFPLHCFHCYTVRWCVKVWNGDMIAALGWKGLSLPLWLTASSAPLNHIVEINSCTRPNEALVFQTSNFCGVPEAHMTWFIVPVLNSGPHREFTVRITASIGCAVWYGIYGLKMNTRTKTNLLTFMKDMTQESLSRTYKKMGLILIKYLI